MDRPEGSGRAAPAAESASTVRLFDKTSLAAICLICILLERREPCNGLVVELKIAISGRTLIHSAVSDTLKSFVVVECWSTRRQPLREASVGFPVHPRLERDPRRMR